MKDTTSPSWGRRISLAVMAGLLGYAVGAVCVSALGTLKAIFSPGIQYSSLSAFLRAPVHIFLEGLIWSVLGGAMFVLPPALLVLTIYSTTFKGDWREVRYERVFALGLTTVLWTPIFLFGFRTRFLDACLAGAGILIGMRTSLRFLNQRLDSQHDSSEHE